MKISDALRGVTQLGIDTAPFIYFVEKHALYFDRVAAIFKLISDGALLGVSGVLTLTEVLTLPMKLGNKTLVIDYQDILMNSRGFRLFPIDSTTAQLAADLRARYNLKTPDALQVASVLHSGSQAFLTNDIGIKRVAELHVLTLDELELDSPPTT